MTYSHQNSEIRSFLSSTSISVPAERKKVIKDDGLLVNSFEELATKVAELAFYNPHHVLLFRGHASSNTNQSSATDLKPSLFLPVKQRLSKNRLIQRMLALKEAEVKFFNLYKEAGLANYQELGRSKFKRWALLEHFGVCRTPLLEVSLSLRVAASVASINNSSDSCIYVLGVPSLGGAMTVDQSGELHVVRLASVFPLTIESHHSRDSYMLGQYTNISDFETDQFALDFDSNFADRLISKFRFSPDLFWRNSGIENCRILPSLIENQDIYKIASEVKNSLPKFED